MRTARWQYTHDDGRVFQVYAPGVRIAAERLAFHLQIPAALIAARLVRIPSLSPKPKKR